MQKHKRAFTLIELLVVVLIIGVLVAVALPQYQLAVDKSHMTQLLTAAKSVSDAQESYYLANAAYTTDWTALDISFPGSINDTTLSTSNGMTLLLTSSSHAGHPDGLYAYSSRLPGIQLIVGFKHSLRNPGNLECYAATNNPRADRLCKNVGEYNRSITGSNIYRL